MTQEEMNVLVPARLKELEEEHAIKVLLAVEAGSRASGLEAPDSDFDIRFLYVHERDYYLELNEHKDVIEQPVNEIWDLAGWDLRKALKLLYKSHPALIEWLHSPIVYASSPQLQDLEPIIHMYFSPRKAADYYCGIVRNQLKQSDRGSFSVKRYLSIVSSLLACQWVIQTQSAPPVSFHERTVLLPDALKEHVKELVRRKKEKRGSGPLLSDGLLDQYIEETFHHLKGQIATLDHGPQQSWDALNAYFMTVINQTME